MKHLFLNKSEVGYECVKRLHAGTAIGGKSTVAYSLMCKSKRWLMVKDGKASDAATKPADIKE